MSYLKKPCPQPFIVAELLMCSLHDYIYHPQADTRTLLVVRLARGIAAALAYLHPTVLHRDLVSHLTAVLRNRVCVFCGAKLHVVSHVAACARPAMALCTLQRLSP